MLTARGYHLDQRDTRALAERLAAEAAKLMKWVDATLTRLKSSKAN